MGFGQDLRQVAKGWRWTRRPVLPASVERERDPATDFPTAWGRTPAGRAAREVVQRFGLAPLLHFEVETEVCGREVLDTIEPPAIFVLNHSSHLDAPTILTSLPTRWRRKAVVGAASDYFFDTWYRSIATTIAFNAFPVARSGGLRSARMARQLISEGWSLVLTARRVDSAATSDEARRLVDNFAVASTELRRTATQMRELSEL